MSPSPCSRPCHRPLARSLPALVAAASLATLTAAAAAPPHRPVSDAPAFAAESDAWIPEALDRLGVPALALAVAVGDETVLARAWGMADREAGIPADAQTQFHLASATKSFTALMACLLQSEGALDLESALADHLHGVTMAPELRPQEVKLRDLLTHTAGIEDAPIAYRLAFTGEHDPELLWQLLSVAIPATGAPLGTYRYTNVGYNILTIITDRETGKVWQDQLRDRIFVPLGMSRTTAYASLGEREGWPSTAPYFALGPDGVQRIDLRPTDATMQSAGGLLTTAEDLGRWLRFQMNDGRLDGRQIVDAGIVQGTHEPLVSTGNARSPSPFTQNACGLGWLHGTFRGHRVLSHGGGFGGFVSLVAFLPDPGVGVAVMVNEGSVGAPLMDAVATRALTWWLGTAEGGADAIIPSLVQRKETFAQGAAADRAKRAERTWMLSRPLPRYAGTYRNDLFGTIRVVAEGDTALDVSQGRLRCKAEPSPQAESARVELIPGSARALGFEPAEGAVERVILDGAVYRRVE